MNIVDLETYMGRRQNILSMTQQIGISLLKTGINFHTRILCKLHTDLGKGLATVLAMRQETDTSALLHAESLLSF